MEENRLYTRTEVCNILSIEKYTLRRRCNKHFKELKLLGYRKGTKFMNEKCLNFLKLEYPKTKIDEIQERYFKKDVAKKIGITERTLSRWTQVQEIFERLTKAGYKKNQKCFTPKQYEIIEDEFNIE